MVSPHARISRAVVGDRVQRQRVQGSSAEAPVHVGHLDDDGGRPAPGDRHEPKDVPVDGDGGKTRVDDGRVRLCHGMQPVQAFADDVVGQWLWRIEGAGWSASALPFLL